jgi:hypothetical protein
VPGTLARSWDFSNAANGFVVVDFLSRLPFVGNVVPQSLVDPLTAIAFKALPVPTSPATTGPNGIFNSSGTLPPGGHFVIGGGVLPNLANLGGFSNIANVPGVSAASFQLYVDNLLIASKSVSFTVD